ncbi:MAG TPA: ABC transporter permease [Vicinamibacterales bacterium]|nr:ABC transporter permease [Vicinamibacterales bacterium]
MRRFFLRMRNAIAPGRAERELTREVSAHLRMLEEEYRRRGLGADEAATAARRALGGVDQLKDYHRDARSFLWLDNLRRDSAYAVRSLVRSPGFSLVAIATLALAIGANTALFTVVDRVLLRSVPLPNADRLARLYESNAVAKRLREDPSLPDVADWRLASKSFDLFAALGGTSFTMTGAKEPESLVGMRITPEFFPMSGVTLELGRPFEPSEYGSTANAALGPMTVKGPVTGSGSIIIGHALWQRQFGGDPGVVGRHVQLNGRDAVVTGVMPAGIWLDTTAYGVAEIWLPVGGELLGNRRSRQFKTIGRLAPGVTIEAASAEMKTIAASIAQSYPKENANWTVEIAPLKESVTKGAQSTLWILFAGGACVLLVACANIASLLLMRAAGRSREVAIRMAIGAGRGRLVSQWLTEGMVLALAGGLGGFLLALWVVPTLVSFAPADLPRLNEISVDLRIFAFCLALSFFAGLLSGLAPALASRGVTVAALRASSALSSGPRRRWLRPVLVAVQVGISIVLLVGAGLMARSLLAASRLELGFDPERVLTFNVSTRGDRYQGLAAVRAFHNELAPALERLPGVESAAVGGIPLQTSFELDFLIDGRTEPVTASGNVPTPHYFRALGARFLAGRDFTDQDDDRSERVVIVTRAFAIQAWGDVNVLGRQLRIEYADGPRFAVIGVLNDIRTGGLEQPPRPMVFIPLRQSTVATLSSYVVRTSGPPMDVLPLVRDAVKRLDPDLAISRVATMEERMSKAISPRRFNLWLVGLFSVVALVLAGCGVYGLINEAVTSRTPEIGVRVALGATGAQVIRIVASGTILVTSIGLVLGLAGSAASARLLGSMLFGVEPLDPVTLVAVPIVFVVIAIVAAVAPARRATRVDPVIALRGE